MSIREDNFMSFSLVLVAIFMSCSCSYGENVVHHPSASKQMMVAEIIKKVSNLTTNYLSNARGETKTDVLNKIEEKLKNTARSNGFDGDRYVDLIMKGVKSKTFGDSQENVSDKMDPQPHPNALRTIDETEVRPKTVLKTKKELIPMIAKKLEILSRAYLQNATSHEDKLKALEEIKSKLMKSAQRKHMEIHDKHADIKTYNNLIAEGLKIMMQRTIMDDLGRRNNDKHFDEDIEAFNDDNIVNLNLIDSMNNRDNTSDYCNNVIEETCLNIQSINVLTCANGKNVPIEKLCDGVSDCTDESDEFNCTAKVMEKLRKANNLISDVETSLSHKCIKQDVADKIVSPQNHVLRDVLQTQIKFLEKYTNTNSPVIAKEKTVVESEFLKILNDVAFVLGTLAIAFQGTLCAPRSRKNFESFIKTIEDDNEGAEEAWSPRSCSCKGQYCSDTDCATPCNRVCWQKYSLDHWTCQAANGGNSISLDEICDGKLDCFDETDENSCASGGSYSRFESHEMFKDAIEMILEKTKLKEYESSRNKILTFLELVKQLQKETAGTYNDLHAIKVVRGQTFLMLVEIYEDILQTATLPELDKAYIFLQAVNGKLVEALKRSQTGNELILSSEGCFCRDGHCSLRRCSKKCIRTCIVEPRLTKYICSGTNENTTIFIDAVCNNINDCPKADDEIGCKKEVCRPHHLMVMRHNLRDVGYNKRGTALGEVLIAWRTKVIATIMIAENNHRTNTRIINDVVNGALRDLVNAYSTVDDKGPTTDYIMKEFEKTANIVMKTLRSCGK